MTDLVLDQMLSGPMTDSERDYARLFFCQGGCPQRPETLTRMGEQTLQARDADR